MEVIQVTACSVRKKVPRGTNFWNNYFSPDILGIWKILSPLLTLKTQIAVTLVETVWPETKACSLCFSNIPSPIPRWTVDLAAFAGTAWATKPFRLREKIKSPFCEDYPSSSPWKQWLTQSHLCPQHTHRRKLLPFFTSNWTSVWMAPKFFQSAFHITLVPQEINQIRFPDNAGSVSDFSESLTC